MSFPATTPSYATSDNTMTLNEFGHLTRHTDMQTDLIGLSGKVGTGASTPSVNKVLTGSGTGTSSWSSTLAGLTLTSPVVNTPTGIVKGDVGLGNVDNNSTATIVATVLATIYYVGRIIYEETGVNPATTWGFGTWEEVGQGRVFVSHAASGTFGVVAGTTGGVETVTLTAAQSGLPAHTHMIVTNGAPPTATTGKVSIGNASATDGVTSTANAAANAVSAHTNLQPYYIVYAWKRTA